MLSAKGEMTDRAARAHITLDRSGVPWMIHRQALFSEMKTRSNTVELYYVSRVWSETSSADYSRDRYIQAL